jgi:hypothetical protein
MAKTSVLAAVVRRGIKMAIAVATTGRTYRLSRRARLVRSGLILALLITACNQLPQMLSGAFASATKSQPGVVHYITVRAGDSLWSLAERYAPNEDPRDWIDAVTVGNNIADQGIYPGERLALPNN